MGAFAGAVARAGNPVYRARVADLTLRMIVLNSKQIMVVINGSYQINEMQDFRRVSPSSKYYHNRLRYLRSCRVGGSLEGHRKLTREDVWF
jgi:hypothetical protein